MASKHHHPPISGGDRKALTKELAKSRAMTTIFAERSAEKRREGEALIRKADNLACPLGMKRCGPMAAPSIHRGRLIKPSTADNRRKTMSQTASTLLLRNLHDVFGEIDPVRRRAAIDEIFHQDAVFYEPNGAYRGRDEIDRIAGVIKATHPDFQYQPLSPPEEIGDGCRVRWVSGSPGKPPAYAGTDFIIVRDGKIAAVYLFFDELP